MDCDPKNRLSGPRGTSLIEVVVALGILGSMLVAVNQYLFYQEQKGQRDLLLYQYEKLAAQVESNLRTPSTLYLSLFDTAVNGTFIACVLGARGRGINCPSPPLSADAALPFALYEISDQSPGAGPLRLSSAADKAVFYDIHGRRCPLDQPRGELCVFQLSTFFYLTCTDSCRKGASEIFTTYELKQVAGTLNDPKLPHYLASPLPNLPKVTKYFAAAVVDVIGSERHDSCYFNATRTGFANGRPICQCLFPYEGGGEPIRDGDGIPMSPDCHAIAKMDITCGLGQYLRGYDKNTGRAICKGVGEAFVKNTSTGVRDFGIHRCPDAPTPSWIHSLQHASCQFSCTYQLEAGIKCMNTGSTAVASVNCPVQSTTCLRPRFPDE